MGYTIQTIADIFFVSGQIVLNLTNPGAAPNVLQIHALKMLTHTFPLLTLPNLLQQSSFPTTTLQHHAVPREVNQLLQQLGLPALRLQNPGQPQNRGLIRDIPLRPLLAPFMMLIIRTLLLVYFVSPARKPVFGIVVGAWILYEAWGPIRAAIMGPAERHAAAAAALAGAAPRRQENGGAARPGAAPVQNGDVQQPMGPNVGPRAPPRAAQHISQADALLDSMANINIQSEGEALAAAERAVPAEEPGFVHKFMAFVALFVLTLHPAVWNRRRVILRQREGRTRTEANAREREPETPSADIEGEEAEAARQERERVARVRAEYVAQHERRPRWVQAYVERVRGGEWVDD